MYNESKLWQHIWIDDEISSIIIEDGIKTCDFCYKIAYLNTSDKVEIILPNTVEDVYIPLVSSNIVLKFPNGMNSNLNINNFVNNWVYGFKATEVYINNEKIELTQE